MLNNINNIFRNILSKHHKITLLLSTILLFTIIYLTLDDINFSGVNKFQEIVRDDVGHHLNDTANSSKVMFYFIGSFSLRPSD